MSLLFRQERVGKDGRPFTMLKIETMRDGVVTRPRLRRWGLDELPQIVNVLRGDMALFGPRPELPAIHERASSLLGETWDERLRVKPGILSLDAVAGASRTVARYAPDVMAMRAIHDNTMIDSGLRVKWAVMRRLPGALLRGQEA